MDSPGHSFIRQWKSTVYLVLYLALLLAVESSTAFVTTHHQKADLRSISDTSNQMQGHNEHYKRIPSSGRLEQLRSLMELKRRQLQQPSTLQLAETDPSMEVRDLSRLIDILKRDNAEVSLLLSPIAADTEDDVILQPSSSEESLDSLERDLEREDDSFPAISLYSSPYNEEDSMVDSYASSSPELTPRLLKRLLPRQEVKRGYGSSSRSRYMKRVLPCYWHVVSCY